MKWATITAYNFSSNFTRRKLTKKLRQWHETSMARSARRAAIGPLTHGQPIASSRAGHAIGTAVPLPTAKGGSPETSSSKPYSVNLEMYRKLLIGRKFFKTVESKLSFLRIGRTKASFQSVGNIPVSNERLIILVITGNKTSRQLTTNCVGIGSKEHEFLEPLSIKDLTLCSVSGTNLSNTTCVVVQSSSLDRFALTTWWGQFAQALIH